MMFRAVPLAITLLWLTTGAAAAGEAHAQATDAAPAAPGPTDPASCTVEPRTMAELRQIIDAAAQARATPAPEPSPLPLSALPPGEPADAETVAAITATVEQAVACRNATDTLRYLALLSDDLLRALAVDLAYFIVEDRTGLRTPTPLYEEDWIHLEEISCARVLPDGRVGAVVEAGGQRSFLIFVADGDRCLIDDDVAIEDAGEDSCAESTPVAGA
jgi:hypothetical protein